MGLCVRTARYFAPVEEGDRASANASDRVRAKSSSRRQAERRRWRKSLGFRSSARFRSTPESVLPAITARVSSTPTPTVRRARSCSRLCGDCGRSWDWSLWRSTRMTIEHVENVADVNLLECLFRARRRRCGVLGVIERRIQYVQRVCAGFRRRGTGDAHSVVKRIDSANSGAVGEMGMREVETSRQRKCV